MAGTFLGMENEQNNKDHFYFVNTIIDNDFELQLYVQAKIIIGVFAWWPIWDN
jgi:hypothetical protein